MSDHVLGKPVTTFVGRVGVLACVCRVTPASLDVVLTHLSTHPPTHLPIANLFTQPHTHDCRQDAALGFAAYALVTSTHIYTAYRSVQCIPLSTLNPARLELLASHYIDTATALTPQQLRPQDPCLFLPRLLNDARFLPRIFVGTRLDGMRGACPLVFLVF